LDQGFVDEDGAMSLEDVEAVVVVVTLVPKTLLVKSISRKVVIPAKHTRIFPPKRLSDKSMVWIHGKQQNSSGNSPTN
jgi:hypothetical protein